MAHDHFYGICENKCLVEIEHDNIPGVVPVEKGGTGATTASKAVSNFKTALVDLLYPVGSIHMSVNSANPSTYFGGTWKSWGAGRVPVGVNTSDSSFSTVEKTGGAKTHTLTIDEMPAHTHKYTHISPFGPSSPANNSTSSTPYDGSQTGSAGGSQPHNNLQPYITCYMWKRTA